MNDETMMGVIHSSYLPSVVTTNIHYWSRVSGGWEPGESVWMIPNPPTYQGTRQPLFVAHHPHEDRVCREYTEDEWSNWVDLEKMNEFWKSTSIWFVPETWEYIS